MEPYDQIGHPANPEDILESGLCIFHDKNYLKGHSDLENREHILRAKLTEVMDNCMFENRQLTFVGYRLPTIAIDRIFDVPILTGHVSDEKLLSQSPTLQKRLNSYKLAFVKKPFSLQLNSKSMLNLMEQYFIVMLLILMPFLVVVLHSPRPTST